MSNRRLPVALVPLATPIFRWIWLGALISNLGSWMQNVGAAWLMVSLSHSPLLIALVQTASTLPVFLLGVPAGVIADRVDRRRLLLVTQSWMLAAATALGVLTLMGRTGPWTLLALTFALGIGTSMNSPAWQATIPQLVAREQLPAAVALNSVQFNVARSLGPALGGVVVAVWSPGIAFLLNAISFLAVIVVLAAWRKKPHQNPDDGEGFFEATLAGARYVQQSAVLNAVLTRTAAFIFFASAIWALLPVVAAHEMGGSSSVYGILLGCLGAGSVISAISFAHLHKRVKADRLLLVGTLLYTIATLGLGGLNRFDLLAVAMLAGGVAWMGVMSTFNVTAQLSLPGWVRARALSFYIFTYQAGLALGSWTWGEVALRVGARRALFLAAGGLVLSLLLAPRFPLHPRAENSAPAMVGMEE